MTTHTKLLMVSLILVAATGTSKGQNTKEAGSSPRIDKIENRVNELQTSLAALEKRLAKLEESLRPLLERAGPSGATRERQGTKGVESAAVSLIEVKVSNKRFQASDPGSRLYSDYIWYDATYLSKLQKKTRSIKGVLQFCDLFGEPHFKIRVTIDEPIDSGNEVTTSGIGFEYNQFRSDHHWMLATSLTDMTFKLRVEAILYADGTRDDLSSREPGVP